MQDASLHTLLFLIALAMAGPMIAIKLPVLRIPTAVLEILLGILLGKSGLHLFSPNAFLQHLSELGLLFLMFLAGMEVQFHPGNSSRSGSPWIAGATFLLTLLMSMICAWFFTGGKVGLPMWMMALLFTTSSVGIIVPVIRENGLLSSDYGQTILQAALLADILTLLLLSIVITAASSSQTAPHSFWTPLLALAGWGIFLYLLSGTLQTWIYQARAELPSSQIGIRAALSLLGATLFVTYELHLELILGSFVAGVLLSLLGKGEHHVLYDKLEGIGYGFLFPIFFFSLGMGFDLKGIHTHEAGFLVLALLICAYLVKLIGVLPFRLRYTRWQTLGAGVLLSTRFTLVIAVSTVGVKLGLINHTVDQALVVVAICTVLISPLLFGQWRQVMG